jgi:hypothetical protein
MSMTIRIAPNSLITITAIIIMLIGFSSIGSSSSLLYIQSQAFTNKNNNDNNKVIILNFYDNAKSQYMYAKPILDKYGFKASFFVVCNWMGRSNESRMTWQDIDALHKDGQDIESHTMNHKNLNKLSFDKLNFEIGQSKKCLLDHNINATVFAPPHGDEWNNSTIVNTVAKYYNLALGGFSTIMYLHCDGWKHSSSQTDCRTYFDNGTLTPVNRYSIREWSHNALDQTYSHNGTKIFEKFVENVNYQNKSNINNNHINSDERTTTTTTPTTNAISIIGYHSIDNNKKQDSTDVDLFAAEMKYLHDNSFKVLNMADIAYDKNGNYLYIKQ